jgi:hypothetical protein
MRLPQVPEPRATVRPGRIAIARLCLLLGALCGVVATAVGLPVVQLLPGGVTGPVELHLTAQAVWALLGIGLLIVGNVIVAGEFNRIDWEWQLEDLL